MRHLPGIKRGKDYHFHAKTLLESSPLAIQFPKEIFSQTIDGVEFDVMYTETSLPTGTVKQEQYATIIKGYALVLIISYTTEEEKSSLKGILGSVTFE